MSVEIACTCDDLPAHSHVYRLGVDVDPMYPDTTVVKYIQDEFDIRIWVDWKAVARDLMNTLEAVDVRFIGGVMDGITVGLKRTPRRLLIGRFMYSRLDDPDTGEFLGGYSVVAP